MIKLTKEECREVVSKFKTIKDLRREQPSLYAHILYRKWTKDLLSGLEYANGQNQKRRSLRYSEEELIAIANKYSSAKEFREHENALYYNAWRRGILDKVTANLYTRPTKSRTIPECIEIACKYKTWRDFRLNERRVYFYASTRGILGDIKKAFFHNLNELTS